jgi:hypothetical protein
VKSRCAEDSPMNRFVVGSGLVKVFLKTFFIIIIIIQEYRSGMPRSDSCPSRLFLLGKVNQEQQSSGMPRASNHNVIFQNL